MVNEMTKYYLIKTNASKDVVAVCDGKMYVCPEKSGVDVNSGIRYLCRECGKCCGSFAKSIWCHD